MIKSNGEIFHLDAENITGMLRDNILTLPLYSPVTTGNELRRESEDNHVYLVTITAPTINCMKATLAKSTHTVTVKRLSASSKDTFGRGTGSYTTIYSMPVVMEGDSKTPTNTTADRLSNETRCTILVSDSYRLHQADILEFPSGTSFKLLDTISPITGIQKVNLLFMSA